MCTGGFSFLTPWALWGTLLLFGCGWVFAQHPADKTWRKVLGINLSWLLLIPAVVRGQWWSVLLLTAGTLVPTYCGVRLRLRRRSAGVTGF